MACAWFKFNPPGVPPNPATNPLSYTIFLSTPRFVTGSPTVAYIYATIQIISGVQRPVIPAVSPKGYVTVSEINTAILTQTSSVNCYVS